MAYVGYISGKSRLATARIMAGLTQDQLAERTGVSQGYICALERGYAPSRHTAALHKLADALDLETFQLFAGHPEDDRLPREMREAALV